MGQIVKQLAGGTTRYYWYPGDRKEYLRAVVALIAGGVTYAVLHFMTGSVVLPAVAGTSITSILAGFNFGRRDSRAIAAFSDAVGSGQEQVAAKPLRRKAVAHSGRAAWRGIVEGTGGAAAAVLIVNLPADGVVANWLLPLVPAVLGALAHQLGMVVERLGHSRAANGPGKKVDTAAPDGPKTAEQRLAEARSNVRERKKPPVMR